MGSGWAWQVKVGALVANLGSFGGWRPPLFRTYFTGVRRGRCFSEIDRMIVRPWPLGGKGISD